MPGRAYLEIAAEIEKPLSVSSIADAVTELLNPLIIFRGTTTGNGGVGGANLLCADLTLEPEYDGNTVIILSGLLAKQTATINGTTLAGIVNADPVFGGQIVIGVDFAIVSFRTGAAALAAIIALLNTIVGFEGATSLADKLTLARAALLDNLDALVSTRAPAATALSTAVWTAARAALLDNLLAGVSTVGSPYSQPNDVNEHDVIIVAAATQIVDIELDMFNLAQPNTVREYVQVDGVNYRQISAKIFPTNFDPGTEAVILSFAQKGQLYKVSMQASGLEGAPKDVPYRIMMRDLT